MSNQDDKLQDNTNKDNTNRVDTSEECKINIHEFFNELDLTFSNILKEKSSAVSLLNSFKNKYTLFNFNNYVNFRECIDFHDTNNYELKLITIIFNAFLSFQANQKQDLFFNSCVQILDILWNCYLLNSFSNKFDESIKVVDKLLHDLISSKNHQNCIYSQLKELFILIGNEDLTTSYQYFNCNTISLPNCRHSINRFLNELIMKILENNVNKEFISSLNFLIHSRNKSSFLSLKLILLFLQSLIKLNYEIKFYDSITMYIALLLKEEGTLLSGKINDERFNFQFSDFDYGNPTNTRKLSLNETNLLKNTLFGFIILILEVLNYKDNSFKNKIFVNLNNYSVHYELNDILEECISDKKIVKNNLQATLYYKSYIFLCFTADILDFVYSNFLYKSECFENSEKFSMDIDPFLSLNHKKIIIKDFQNFISIFVFKYLYNLSPNYLELIHIFIKINEFKGKNAEKLPKSEEMCYVIYEPFNPIGFSIMSWIVFKFHFINNVLNLNYFPLITGTIYLLDCYLPIIAALFKRGELFIYMGMEILLYLLSLIEDNSINDTKTFTNYSYEELLMDAIKVAGGQLSNNKKETLTRGIFKYFTILKGEARNQLFMFAMKNSDEDGQIAFLIYILKNYMTEVITKHEYNRTSILNNAIFNEYFIKYILDLNFNLDLCIMDVIENIAQSLNFFHFLLIQDKSILEGHLGIFNRMFLNDFSKKLVPIFKIIEAWTLSVEYEKKKFYENNEYLRMNTNKFNMQKKEIEKNFEIKRNKSLLTINLIRIVENLIHEYLKLL